MTTCMRAFPCRPESVAVAREWAARCLPDPASCPVTDDVVLCVSELVTNSAQHSLSGLLPGGQVRLRICVAAGAWVRIEVRDAGPADWTAPDQPVPRGAGTAGMPEPSGLLAEAGRGLWLVRMLSGGQAGTNGKGLHWVRLPWSGAPAAPDAELAAAGGIR